MPSKMIPHVQSPLIVVEGQSNAASQAANAVLNQALRQVNQNAGAPAPTMERDGAPRRNPGRPR